MMYRDVTHQYVTGLRDALTLAALYGQEEGRMYISDTLHHYHSAIGWTDQTFVHTSLAICSACMHSTTGVMSSCHNAKVSNEWATNVALYHARPGDRLQFIDDDNSKQVLMTLIFDTVARNKRTVAQVMNTGEVYHVITTKRENGVEKILSNIDGVASISKFVKTHTATNMELDVLAETAPALTLPMHTSSIHGVSNMPVPRNSRMIEAFRPEYANISYPNPRLQTADTARVLWDNSMAEKLEADFCNGFGLFSSSPIKLHDCKVQSAFHPVSYAPSWFDLTYSADPEQYVRFTRSVGFAADPLPLDARVSPMVNRHLSETFQFIEVDEHAANGFVLNMARLHVMTPLIRKGKTHIGNLVEKFLKDDCAVEVHTAMHLTDLEDE